MENIKAFLDAVEMYGLAKEDTFVTVDLFEGRNMKQVMSYSTVRKFIFCKKFVWQICNVMQFTSLTQSRMYSIVIDVMNLRNLTTKD